MFESLFSRGGISLDRLVNFCEIAEKGGLAKAAGGDAARQSLFSRQVKELEAFFGTALTERRGKVLVLTAEGEELARIARAHFKALDDFASGCSAKPLSVSLAAGNAILEWVVLPRLEKLRELLPETVVELHNERNNEVYQGLVEGVFDFGILRRDSIHRPLKWGSLGLMRYGLYMPREWLAARPKKQSPDETIAWVAKHPLALTTGRQSMDAFSRLGEKLGVAWQVALRTTAFTQSARALCAGGVGAVLPILATGDLPEHMVGRVDGFPLEVLDRELCLAWNPRTLSTRPLLERVVDDIAGLLTLPER